MAKVFFLKQPMAALHLVPLVILFLPALFFGDFSIDGKDVSLGWLRLLAINAFVVAGFFAALILGFYPLSEDRWMGGTLFRLIVRLRFIFLAVPMAGRLILLSSAEAINAFFLLRAMSSWNSSWDFVFLYSWLVASFIVHCAVAFRGLWKYSKQMQAD